MKNSSISSVRFLITTFSLVIALSASSFGMPSRREGRLRRKQEQGSSVNNREASNRFAQPIQEQAKLSQEDPKNPDIIETASTAVPLEDISKQAESKDFDETAVKAEEMPTEAISSAVDSVEEERRKFLEILKHDIQEIQTKDLAINELDSRYSVNLHNAVRCKQHDMVKKEMLNFVEILQNKYSRDVSTSSEELKLDLDNYESIKRLGINVLDAIKDDRLTWDHSFDDIMKKLEEYKNSVKIVDDISTPAVDLQQTQSPTSQLSRADQFMANFFAIAELRFPESETTTVLEPAVKAFDAASAKQGGIIADDNLQRIQSPVPQIPRVLSPALKTDLFGDSVPNADTIRVMVHSRTPSPVHQPAPCAPSASTIIPVNEETKEGGDPVLPINSYSSKHLENEPETDDQKKAGAAVDRELEEHDHLLEELEARAERDLANIQCMLTCSKVYLSVLGVCGLSAVIIAIEQYLHDHDKKQHSSH